MHPYHDLDPVVSKAEALLNESWVGIRDRRLGQGWHQGGSGDIMAFFGDRAEAIARVTSPRSEEQVVALSKLIVGARMLASTLEVSVDKMRPKKIDCSYEEIVLRACGWWEDG